jgi:hypothetical protein
MGEIPRKDQFKSVKDTFKQPLAEVYLKLHTFPPPEHFTPYLFLSRLQYPKNKTTTTTTTKLLFQS